MGSFVQHEPCPNPECKSGDALARYADGSAHCFSCRSNYKPDGEMTAEGPTPKDWQPISGDYRELTNRGISEETCRHWKYQTGFFKGEEAHIMNYRNSKGLVAQKFRMAGKKFAWVGDAKEAPLYGQWLSGKGKSVVITEGEIDALSVSQAFDNKWPVVSLANGAQSAAKAIEKSYEWLDGFERIVLMFDQDEPGQTATQLVAAMLPVGKAYVAALPAKDANATLIEFGKAAVVQAYWNATLWMPDGIVSGSELTVEMLKSAMVEGYEWQYPKTQAMTYGLRKAELTLLTAGSGIGKSTLAREAAYDLHQRYGCKIGNVFLEESNAKTGQAYVAIHNNIPLKDLRKDTSILTDEQWAVSHEAVLSKNMWFYDHFGSLKSDRLMKKLRYMAAVMKVDFIILDHISIVVSGTASEEGERKDIDILMTNLRSMIEETGVGVIAIVHLKRTKKDFNEGDPISLSDLRGSASLEQLSDNVLGMERDQQGTSPTLATIRVLKCRETGETGEADTLNYDRATGRLVLDNNFKPEGAEGQTDPDCPFEL